MCVTSLQCFIACSCGARISPYTLWISIPRYTSAQVLFVSRCVGKGLLFLWLSLIEKP